MGKKITVSLSIILICTCTFINGYTYVYPSFADSTTDQWTSVTTNDELAEAFRYYCKSRNLTIDGSVFGSATSFTTSSFNNICNKLGINMTALQADLKRSTDGNGGVQYLFNTSGVSTYNRIFAELLQNNNIDVGDQVDDVVFTGEYVKDADGYGAFVYVVSRSYTSSSVSDNSAISASGSIYKYSTYDIVQYCSSYGNATDIPLNFTDDVRTKSLNIRQSLDTPPSIYINSNQSNYTTGSGLIYYHNNVGDYYHGHMAIFRMNQTYYVGIASNYKIEIKNANTAPTITNGIYTWRFDNSLVFVPSSSETSDIIFNTYNKTINNNTYNDNKQTVINNQGDVNNYDYDDEDPPVNPPSGGGGGTVTPPTDSGGTDGDITFPNFDFQLPEIDWSLGDLSEKFPFSIPFDLIAFFTVLNAEPQAPSIDANIPLGSWYTWHFQADFSQFNNWATIIRNVEFIAFCIGLIYLTIRLVKG